MTEDARQSSVTSNSAYYINSRKNEPHVLCRFNSDNFDIKLPLLADTGADNTINNSKCFPAALLKYLRPSNLVTRGVGGALTESKGVFNSTVEFVFRTYL